MSSDYRAPSHSCASFWCTTDEVETVFLTCVFLATCLCMALLWEDGWRLSGRLEAQIPRDPLPFLFPCQRKDTSNSECRSPPEGRGKLPVDRELKHTRKQTNWAGRLVLATRNNMDITGTVLPGWILEIGQLLETSTWKLSVSYNSLKDFFCF